MEDKNKVSESNLEKLVATTIAETMKAIMPLLQNQHNTAAAPATSQDVRTAVARAVTGAFDAELKANEAVLRALASAPPESFTMITIPRVYASYFGSTMPAGLNGSIINIPIDNQPHRIHKAFLPIIKACLDYADEKIAFMNKTERNDTRLVDRSYLQQ